MKTIERYDYWIHYYCGIEYVVDGLVASDDKEVWYADFGIELKIHDTQNE